VRCLFCDRVSGRVTAPPLVYSDEVIVAYPTEFPLAVGHLLVFPRKHARDLMTLDDWTAAQWFVVAKKLAAAVKRAHGSSGVTILQRNGRASGQSIDHVHLHVIPRVKGDGLLPKKGPPFEDIARVGTAQLVREARPLMRVLGDH
jgi:histidine triad (HIT) family protein